MWKYLWSEHRSHIYAAAGAILFLLSGMAVSVLSSNSGSGGGDIPLLNVGEPVSAGRETIPASGEAPSKTEGEDLPAQADPVPQPEAPANWCLYITGSIRKPGIYNLPPGSRLFQLVEAAGGFNGLADKDALNLAERLEDGRHVHVPSKSEVRSARLPRGEPRGRGMMIVVENPSSFSASSSSRREFQTPGKTRSGGLIDINHAPEEDLERLRGIGPTLARRIVEYRQQHGPFRSVEELAQVRGIGAVKVNGLRGQATVSP